MHVQRIMTMEELEAQLRRKTQQQQQQQQQRMAMTGVDPSMQGGLGQLGPSGQPSLSTQQLPAPGAFQQMQHGPPGFPHPAGLPQRPPEYNNQHPGIGFSPYIMMQSSVSTVQDSRKPGIL